MSTRMPYRSKAGSAVNETLAANGVAQMVINHGLPDQLIPHGSREDMLNEANLNTEGILDFIQQYFDKKVPVKKIKSA